MINPVLWLIIENAVKIFEIYLSFAFLGAFFDRKYNSQKIYTGVYFGFFVFLTVLYYLKTPPQINLLASSILLILAAAFFYKGKLLKKVLVSILYSAIFAFTEVGIVYCSMVLLGLSFDGFKEKNFYAIVPMFLTKIALFIIIKWIARFIKKTNAQKIPLNYWLLLMVVPIVTSVAMFSGFSLIRNSDANAGNPYIIAISFMGLLFTNIIVFYLFESLLASEEIKYSYKAVQSQMELQEKHYNEIEENQKETRRIWHDLKHHINYIGLMLKDNNTDGARDYLIKLESATDSLITPINSGNITVDAILSQKYTNAKRKNIEIKFDVLLSEEVNIEMQDLCVLLSNALDNAIEACEKITDERIKREIAISMASERSFLKIRVTNPTASPPMMKDNEWITTKLDEKNHGIGLKSIKKITEKYEGAVTIKTDENGFDLLLILNLKKEIPSYTK